MPDAGCRMPFVRCRTRRREGFLAIKRIGRIRRPGRAPPASGPNRRASGGDSTSPRACPLPFDESTASAGPDDSTPARELHPQPSDANSSSPRACPLPLNESTVSAGPDAPRLPANSTRNRRTSTRHRGELPPAIRCIESAARNPTRPVACRSDPQNRSSPRRHGVERRPPASHVPPTAPLARRASRAARAPARRARSGKPPPRNRAHRVDQRARDG